LSIRFVVAAIFVILSRIANGAGDTTAYEWSAEISVQPALISSDEFDLESPSFRVSVKNTGTRTWHAASEHLSLSYHLRAATAEGSVKFDNGRFGLADLQPGQSDEVKVPVPHDLKTASGKFILAFDIVREDVAWFAARNPANRFPETVVNMRTSSLAELREKPALKPAKALAVGIDDIDLATSLAFFTLHKSPRAFRTPLGDLTALTAGATYPQSWIRDCATGVAAAYLVLGNSAARNCIVLHLLHQADDGSVNDWVDGDGNSDKNTVESDQESSLVVAAAEYVAVSADTSFLSSRINDVAVLDRLGLALDYVWAHRRDAETGLVLSGHTIDWGDVSIEESGRKAVYLGPQSPRVVGIYTNAMFSIAIRDYRRLLAIHGAEHQDRDARWADRLHLLGGNISKYLWNEAQGYFVMHRHVTPLNVPMDDTAMFVLGGNAVAIEAGIANNEQADQIIGNALRLQNQYHAATISGVLYPPFAEGVYRHPLVRRPFQYQNGGLWDWFGLRLVGAMFETDHAAAGCRSLAQIAAKVVRNKTFSEWDDLNGQAEGSRNYLGAAGEYIAAVQKLNSYVTQIRRRLPAYSAQALCAQSESARAGAPAK